MAKIPENYDSIVELLEDAADGARDHAAEAKLKQNLEADIRAELAALVGTPAVAAGPGNVPPAVPAVPGLKSAWNTAKAKKIAMTAALRSQISVGKSLAAACVGVLKLRLGSPWNSAWNAAGFTNGSLAIPQNPQVLLQQIAAYFIANPSHEVPDLSPTISATAAACASAADAISTASTASNNSNSDAGTAKAALEEGITVGRNRLSGLRAELDQTLSDDDPLWYAFGFQRPSDPHTPEVPLHVVITPGAAGSGVLFIDWDDARRADSYRARILSNGTPPLEITMRLVSESEATFTGLSSGMSVRVEITAINDAGESQPSQTVTVAVP